MDRMLPDLQASFACEDVRVEASGAHTIVGIVNVIAAPSFPVRLLKFCIWTRWTCGVGKFTQMTRVIRPDEDNILGESTTDFELNHEDGHATNVNFFAGVEFPEPGTYHIEVSLDGELKLRYPLTAVIPQALPSMP
jgi:hypothetical protein